MSANFIWCLIFGQHGQTGADRIYYTILGQIGQIGQFVLGDTPDRVVVCPQPVDNYCLWITSIFNSPLWKSLWIR